MRPNLHEEDSLAECAHPGTFFAPPGRATQELVRLLSAITISDPIVKTILASVGGHVLILNAQRQILAASREVMEALDVDVVDSILGRRPGEAFRCVHSVEGPDGCGTGPTCKYCGAVIAILASQTNGAPSDGECWLTMRRNSHIESAEFRVRATPLVIGATPVIALVLHDISALKRREALERVFLHDAKNILGGLVGWSQELALEAPSEAARTILSLSERLTEEILHYNVMLQAEQGSLASRREEVRPTEIVAQICTLFSRHPCAEGKTLATHLPHSPFVIVSDGTLVKSVLTNMVKNAFEATPWGGNIDLKLECIDGRPRFTVRNEGVMPPEVAARVFTRSYSTKPGMGRGLGTYGMRLLGERYLGGKVWFTSTPERGTEFYFELPASSGDSPAASRA